MTKVMLTIFTILMLTTPSAFADYSGNWVGSPSQKTVCAPDLPVNDYRRYDCDISSNRNPGGSLNGDSEDSDTDK